MIDDIPERLSKAIGKLSQALGNPALAFNPENGIEVALVEYAAEWIEAKMKDLYGDTDYSD